MALRTVGIRLMAEISNYTSGMRKAGQDTRGFVAELDKAARAGQLDAVASQATAMGVALAGAFALVVKASAQFEQQMSKVDAVTNTSAENMQRLEQAALEAGKATQFSATEAAKAEEELAKAGIAVADILGGGLKGALSLAAAGSLDLAEAADIAAKTMNLFKLRGSDVEHIADVLSASANKSATDVHELGMALKMGGLAASAAGMSLEETVGTLSAFADRALVGSDAGTSLKTMLMFLQAPTEKAAALMKQLGIEAYDAQGNFVGTTRLAGILQERLSGLTQEQRNAALATIFGADAMRAANVLYNIGEQGVADYTHAVNDQGAAAETAAKKTDNLIGDVERLTGSLETLAIESGSGANQGLRTLVQMANMLVDQFAALPAPISGTAVVLTALAAAGLLVFAAWAKMRGASVAALAELRAMGPAGERAAAGLEKAGKGATKAAIAFIALQVAGAALKSLEKPAADVDKLTKSLEELGKLGTNTGEVTRVLGGDLTDFAKDLERDGYAVSEFARTVEGILPPLRSVEEGFSSLFGSASSFGRARENIEAVDNALTQLVQKGKLSEAMTAATRISQQSGISWDELMKKLPQFAAAVTEAEKANNGLAIAELRAKENAELLAGGLGDAEREGKKVIEVFEQLNGAMISWAEAEIKAEEAIDELTESFIENGKTLDVNTQKGRENKQAVIDAATAAAEAAQKRYEETGSLTAASQTYDLYIGKLRAALKEQGLTESQINELINAFARMPQLVAASVTTPGLDAALAKTQQLLSLRNQLGSNAAAANAYNNSGYVSGRRWGGIVEHAQWGVLREATIASPQSPARYSWAEPATGGEAFVPKRGDYNRSMSILSEAAGWYGATVAPGGGGGGGVQVIVHEHRHTITISGREMWSGFRRQIDKLGGDVQLAAGSKRR